MGYFEWRIPVIGRDGERALTLTLSREIQPPGTNMDDNNYQLDAVTGSKKESDARYQPVVTGKNIALSPRNQYSPGRDLIYYRSSRNPDLELAMLVTKPEKPGYLLATTHGWHMDIGGFSFLDKPNGDYLRVAVDMRGRKYSQGKADANGYELLDVYDAIQFARVLYPGLLSNPEVLYFDAGSGGGGNSLGLVGKFPDLFAAATANCGISDYGLWWETDEVGEFRDELLPWIGTSPDKDPMAYASRGGLTTVANLMTPLTIAHGETDVRVTVEQARRYVAKAKSLGKAGLVNYLELPGVGNRDHWGNATKEQKDAMQKQAEDNRVAHRMSISIPRKGRFVVAGYLVTKLFSVWLDSVDKVATLDYDLDAGTFNLTCAVPCKHEVVMGPWTGRK